MRFYTDGACRRNGQPGATGAAAAVLMKRGGGTSSWFKKLPANPRPTNQRAEITAIIIALRQALVLFRTLQTDPRLDITIYSDSRYAVNCMNEVGVVSLSDVLAQNQTPDAGGAVGL